MKRILSLLACVTVLLSMAVPAFATETETEGDVEPVSDVLALSEYVYVSDLSEPSEPLSESIPAVLVSLFGDYQPRTQTVTHTFADGSEVIYDEYVPGLAGLDWLWLSSVALFGMGLYCVFRVIGGCIKWI